MRMSPARATTATTLAEAVVTIGLLAVIMLVVAAMAVKNHQSGHKMRLRSEANSIAQNRLERQLARSIDQLGVGAPVTETGAFQDSTPYSAVTEAIALPPVGPASGLSDQEVRTIPVVVSWRYTSGTHSVSAESYLAKLQR